MASTPGFEYPFRIHPIIDQLVTAIGPSLENGAPHDAINEALTRLEDRDRALEDYLNNLKGGSGNHYATVLVAASDALAATRANADYLCDGTDDQVEINAAIASTYTAAYRGARVLLSEGTFSISAEIDGGTNPYFGSLGTMPNVVLDGQGKGATVVKYSGSGTDFLLYVYLAADQFIVRNMTFDGNGASQGLWFQNQKATAESIEVINSAGQSAAALDMGSRGRVVNCDFRDLVAGWSAVSVGHRSVVANNYMDHIDGAAVLSGDDCAITGNVGYTIQSSGSGTDVITAGANCAIAGNVGVGGFAPATITAGAGSAQAGNSLS